MSAPVGGPDAAADPRLGQKAGSYVLERVLGQGSFARVYLGVHPVLGDRVAVKVAEARVNQTPDLTQRFVGEARIARQVSHPNIPRIHDIGQLQDGAWYFVMDLLEGQTLFDKYAGQTPPLSEVWPVLEQVCAALSAAHKVGVVHRDLKPEHIFLVGDPAAPEVRLVDFGVARREQLSEGEQRTALGMVMGTPLFMAPEQGAGLAVDGRADLYALGVILYWLCTGRHPFEDPNPVMLMRKHALEPVPPPRTFNPSLPDPVEAVILRCLQKRPEARYADADEMALALKEALLAQGPSAPALLVELEERVGQDPYRLLDIERDLPSAACVAASQALSAQVAALLSDAEAAAVFGDRLRAVLAEVTLAGTRLGAPAERARVDGKLGNFRGVAQLLAEGVDASVIEAAHAELLAARPNLPLVLRPVLAKADDRESRGDKAGTLEAVEAALRLDALDLKLHQRRASLRE